MSKKVAQVIVDTLRLRRGQTLLWHRRGYSQYICDLGAPQSEIQFVHMRHEEAGAFAAQGEATLLNRLTAVAGSCGPGSLHFINGLYEGNRNRAPVILIASQVVRRELGFDFIQEVDFKAVYQGCSVFCEMVVTPEHARRMAVMACQAAISQRGVAVLILPVDVADADAAEELPYSIHRQSTRHPSQRR